MATLVKALNARIGHVDQHVSAIKQDTGELLRGQEEQRERLDAIKQQLTTLQRDRALLEEVRQSLQENPHKQAQRFRELLSQHKGAFQAQLKRQEETLCHLAEQGQEQATRQLEQVRALQRKLLERSQWGEGDLQAFFTKQQETLRTQVEQDERKLQRLREEVQACVHASRDDLISGQEELRDLFSHELGALGAGWGDSQQSLRQEFHSSLVELRHYLGHRQEDFQRHCMGIFENQTKLLQDLGGRVDRIDSSVDALQDQCRVLLGWRRQHAGDGADPVASQDARQQIAQEVSVSKELNPRAGVNQLDSYPLHHPQADQVLLMAIGPGDWAALQRGLEEGANPNVQDEDGNTPLILAARRGWTQALDALLAAGADPALVNRRDETALVYALRRCHVAATQRLLQEKRTLVNKADHAGDPPLFVAADAGELALVRLLLHHPRVDVHKTNQDAQTVLEWAIARASADLVEVLLSSEAVRVQLTHREGPSHTPFARAMAALENARANDNAQSQQQLVILCRLLAEATLTRAAHVGDVTLAQYLLADPNASVNPVDQQGCTPLIVAARRGQRDVLQVLLRDPRTRVNQLDHQAKGALVHALEQAHVDIVGDLLGSDRVEVASDDLFATDPLANVLGHASPQLLQRVRDCRPDLLGSVCQYGCSPLRVAEQEETQALGFLRDHGGVHLSLHEAACDGDANLLERLLVNQDTPLNVNAPNTEGDAPLLVAARHGRVEAVQVLLAHMDIDINRSNLITGMAALHAASGAGHITVVRRLLEHPALYVAQPDQQGHTALWHGAAQGHGELVRMLLERLPEAGYQALVAAAAHGHRELTRQLLAQGELSVPDHGQQALVAAAQSGQVETLQLLLSDERIDPALASCHGLSPLRAAQVEGHQAVVAALRRHASGLSLHERVLGGDQRALEQLARQQGSDCNVCDVRGQTPLQLALAHQLWEQALTLLRQEGEIHIFPQPQPQQRQRFVQAVFQLLLKGVAQGDRLALDAPLNICWLSDKPQLVEALAQHLLASSDYQYLVQLLLDGVAHSRDEPRLAYAAANAMTLLVAAGVPFTGIDLHGICVAAPGDNGWRGSALTGGSFDQTNFTGADLRGADFAKAWLRRAHFDGAQLEGVFFGPGLGHTGPVQDVAFSPDGATLASASYDNTVKLWNLQTGALLRMLEGHSHYVYSVAFSPDGATLASASYDNTVKLWNLQTGALLRTLEGHSHHVYSVSFSPDRATLVSASEDRTVKLWRVNDGSLLRTLQRHASAVYSVAFSPDGVILASASGDKTVKLCRVSDGALLRTISAYNSGGCQCIAWSPDGPIIATGGYDTGGNPYHYRVKLWNPHTGALLHTLEGHTSSIYSVAFSPDGATLASASNDKTICLWNPATGQHLRTIAGHTRVNSVAFSPDNRLLASGSQDNTAKLWDVRTGRLVWSSPPGIKWAEGMTCREAQGLSQENRLILKELGAQE